MVMDRRTFVKDSLMVGGLVLLGANAIVNNVARTGEQLIDKQRKDLLTDFYLTGQDQHHIANHNLEFQIKDRPSTKQERKGLGSIVRVMDEDYYFTCSHICAIDVIPYRTPIGTMYVPVKMISSESKIGDIPLEKVDINLEDDLAIYQLPSGHGLQVNKYLPTKIEPKIGDLMYSVGNPMLKGPTIREGNVCDIDGSPGSTLTKNGFGIDIHTIPGDSGGYVINSNFELVGISNVLFGHSFAYANRISDYVKKVERKETLRLDQLRWRGR